MTCIHIHTKGLISWADLLDYLEHFAAAVAGPHGLGSRGLWNSIQEIETTFHHVCGKGSFYIFHLLWVTDCCTFDNLLFEP